MLVSAELHAGIACSCLRSSMEAAAAHSEAAQEQLTQHQQLASVMVFQVGGMAKQWKGTGVRRMSHSNTAWPRGSAAQACSQLCQGRVCQQGLNHRLGTAAEGQPQFPGTTIHLLLEDCSGGCCRSFRGWG